MKLDYCDGDLDFPEKHEEGYIYIGDLSTRHKQALVVFVEKFRQGALQHGDLVPKMKWTKDKIMEQVDYTFYNIFDLLDVLEEENETTS